MHGLAENDKGGEGRNEMQRHIPPQHTPLTPTREAGRGEGKGVSGQRHRIRSPLYYIEWRGFQRILSQARRTLPAALTSAVGESECEREREKEGGREGKEGFTVDTLTCNMASPINSIPV